ncbi:MAG: NUDIX domain-containing protein [Muribaculaceae bacterium]|nr:NUDIX domain-containing protein [Muribaculaceae bacterium]
MNYKSTDTELFPIVDLNGKVIGKATRSECHSGTKLLHPVVHLHVIATDGSVLLQKRSTDKDIQPGKWDTAVGGHVDFGESINEALMRESREELGIVLENPELLKQYVFESARERELVNTFLIRVDKPGFKVTFDPVEIDETRFWTPDEIESAIEKGGILTPNFESEYNLLKPLLNR